MSSLAIPSVDTHVFRRDGVQLLYLVLHAAPDAPWGGLWQVLTGEIGDGETALAAALRALRGHTGLEPLCAWALDHTHTCYDAVTDRIFCSPVLAFEVDAGTLALSPRYDAARWITYDQALDLLRFSGHRDSLRHIHDDIALKHDRGAPFRVRLS